MPSSYSLRTLTRLDWLLVLIIIILTFTMRLIPTPRSVDDSYITFRYSRNIVTGNGFVYNPGERVLGTTTPTFTLLMAGISLITGQQDFPWYALAVSALADAGTAVLLFVIVRK